MHNALSFCPLKNSPNTSLLAVYWIQQNYFHYFTFTARYLDVLQLISISSHKSLIHWIFSDSVISSVIWSFFVCFWSTCYWTFPCCLNYYSECNCELPAVSCFCSFMLQPQMVIRRPIFCSSQNITAVSEIAHCLSLYFFWLSNYFLTIKKVHYDSILYECV